MINLQIGKLYTCSKYHLLVFPTKQKAQSSSLNNLSGISVVGRRYKDKDATGWAEYWSNRLSCHVSWLPVNEIFMVIRINKLSKNFRQVHVIAGECIGWINIPENNWTKIVEVK